MATINDLIRLRENLADTRSHEVERSSSRRTPETHVRTHATSRLGRQQSNGRVDDYHQDITLGVRVVVAEISADQDALHQCRWHRTWRTCLPLQQTTYIKQSSLAESRSSNASGYRRLSTRKD